jgi:hypothetical protein
LEQNLKRFPPHKKLAEALLLPVVTPCYSGKLAIFAIRRLTNKNAAFLLSIRLGRLQQIGLK